MAPSTLTHNDYTVAWICAVEVELIAACELLEEEYPRLPKQPHDNNAYSFGRIGSHNVVIAGLPSGKYGVSSAAAIAKDLLRSFPYIRIGLMVGIGGGAPNRKHDIRLGDVVVSSPTGETGGVIHYEFGKMIQNKGFEHKGSLNAPPTALLTALHDIRALHARKGHRIVDSANAMIQRNSRLRKKFKHPGLEHDRLYATNYVHVDDDQPCVDVCDDTTLIMRKPRSEDEDNPVIHYGLIASADKLMKDATIRDRLAAEHDVLCFEMEAAGLMDNFPCLVVRGICYYSDTHENDEWQGYAAATAAAYAKELLQAMPGEEVVSTNLVLRTGLKPPVPSAPPKPVFTVPFERDKYFVGREGIITHIEEKLREQHRASLSGWGGMGKSQIAIEYAHRFRKKHPQYHIFWVYAANPSRFYQSYQEIARRLEIPRHNDPAVDVRVLVLNWLNEQDAQWLMILDNADDAELFFPSDGKPSSRENSVSEKPLIRYLPRFLSSSKLLLITTRRKNLGEDLINGEQCIEVPPFSMHEALLLLQERSKDPARNVDSPESTKLMDILGCIPLAINQAAAFIRKNQMSLQKYLAALEKDEKNLKDFLSAELQDARRERGFPNAIFRTWKLSFSQIQEQEPHAAELLALMALFDRRNIPESLLRDPEDSGYDFSTAISTLKTFALIM
ncbi:hypothetical protein GJ744_010332 [Endocarpon pusillum]|uniref:Nucleoside phosphorylase domain-containing protein n=1 Tax=Endocarpon pusillum TaxID=364733 RepID=A0A8H7AI50_9EURO|nr:hypothetical protein GJ744_010332 [Endocarpon pusillum]